MKNKLNKNFFLYFSYILFMLSLFVSDIPLFESSSIYLKFVILLLNGIYLIFCIKKEKIKKIPILYTILCLLIFIFSRDFYWLIVITYMMIIQYLEYDDKKIFKFSFITLLLLTTLTVLLSFFGLLTDYINIRNNNIVRHSYGFYHSNVLPIAYFYLVCYLLIYLKLSNKKINVAFIPILLVIAYILFIYCNSRNSFIFTLLIIILFIFSYKFNQNEKQPKIILFISKNIILICFILTIVTTILYNGTGLLEKINELYTNRLFLQNIAFMNDGLNIINIKVSENVVLDNGYAYLIFRYGLISIILYCIINKRIIDNFKNDSFLLIVFVIICLFNFIDNDLLSYGFLPFMLLSLNQGKNYIKKL